MPRGFYSIPITNTAGTAGTGGSAALDAWEITAASGKPFVLHEVVFGQYSDPADAQAELLSFIIKRGIGATSGGLGQSVTPVKHVTNDQAAGATAEIMNTSQAVAGGGSLTTLRAEPWNAQAGVQYLPTPETRFTFAAGEICVVSITTPADALTFEGTAVIEEIG